MPAEDQVPSMSDSLSDAFESVEQTTEPGTVAPPDQPAANDTKEAPTEYAPAPERARGADGKFVRRETADPQTAPAETPTAPVPADPNRVAPAAPAAVPTDAAPATWSPAAKEKWVALDPTVKADIQRRERDIAQGITRAHEVRQFGDSVMAEFKPYEQILAQEGATPQAAIRALLETSYTLRFGSPEHKHALFMSLAQQYGIDLSHQIDPEKARLQWELDSRNVNDARNAAAQQDALQRDVQGELERFIPGHEHYPTVRTAMAGLISSGVAKDLQDAYDRACWADPTVRAALQLAENARRAQDQAKNRNALLSVNGAPGASSVPAGADPNNLRSLLESQFAGSAGRV